MKHPRRTIAAALVAISAGLGLTACSNEADVVSKNLSTSADNFEIVRRIVFVNGITDKYLLEVVGRCAIADDGNQLEVTCKQGADKYRKHFLGLSNNVTYFAEQVNDANVSPDYYRVTFKPSLIVPDIDIKPPTDLPQNQPR